MKKSEIIQIIKEELKLLERELTDKELKRRDKIADELPDAEFKKRYGKDYKSVKYATATKMAKREENDPEDGKAAPHGSGYNVVKEYNIQALRSLRKVVTEAKFYATYNKGRGQGKAVVTSKESDFTKPRVFKNYNDAMKYVKFANRSPGMTSYWVSDSNMNRIDKSGRLTDKRLEKEGKVNEAAMYKKGQKVQYQIDRGSSNALKPSTGTISKIQKKGNSYVYTVQDGGPVPVHELEIIALSEANRGKVNEVTDINDPVLVAIRAMKTQMKKKTPVKKIKKVSFDQYLKLIGIQEDLVEDMKDTAEDIQDLFRNMEQEAEPSGGPVADKYGAELDKLEKQYATLKKKKAVVDKKIENYRMS